MWRWPPLVGRPPSGGPCSVPSGGGSAGTTGPRRWSAGTDLFLAFAGHGGGFPVIDGAQAQIDALYRAPIKRA